MATQTLRTEIDDFIYRDVDIVEGYSFNQYDTIKRIHLYMNDQFESAGDDKIFHNIVKYRREAIARFLDIDSKDIRLLPTNPKSYYSTLFLEQELKHWLKKNKFGKLLNDMATELATFGSCVLRKTKDGAEIVDLRRLFIDPSVKDIKDSRFITLKHFLTPSQLKDKIKDGWNAEAIDRIIEAVKEKQSEGATSYEDDGLQSGGVSTPLIEVYERFGELTEEEAEECDIKSDKEFVRSHVIIAEPSLMQQAIGQDNKPYLEDKSEILYAKEWKGDYPFRDAHYSKTAGRWLGIGVIEDLFNAQERVNEIENQKRVSMELSSLHLFQTADNTIIQNVMTDLMNGDVVISKSGINPIANEERNLSAFRDEYDSWNVLADRVSFANDLITGNAIPSSTPATNAVIQNTNATSVFLFKRQNFSLFLQEFFNELVLPQCLKDLSGEHILRFVGDPAQLEVIDEVEINDAIINKILEVGRPLQAEEIEATKFVAKEQLSRTGNERFLKIKDNLYDDLEFEFDIIITNEQENIQITQQNTFSLLQSLITSQASGVDMLADPLFKTMFLDYAQKSGLNPAKLELAAGRRQTQPQGGQLQGQPVQPLTQSIDDLLKKTNERINEQGTPSPTA
jgi:hypothetical protein